MFKQASVALVVAGALLGAAQAQSLRFFSWYGTETQTFNDEFVKRASAVAPGVKLEVEPVVWDQMHPLLQSRIALETAEQALEAARHREALALAEVALSANADAWRSANDPP